MFAIEPETPTLAQPAKKPWIYSEKHNTCYSPDAFPHEPPKKVPREPLVPKYLDKMPKRELRSRTVVHSP